MANDRDIHRLSPPRIYLLRMFVFLVISGFLAFILHKQIIKAFWANPLLNGTILIVLFIFVFFLLRRSNRDIPGTKQIPAERMDP